MISIRVSTWVALGLLSVSPTVFSQDAPPKEGSQDPYILGGAALGTAAGILVLSQLCGRSFSAILPSRKAPPQTDTFQKAIERAMADRPAVPPTKRKSIGAAYSEGSKVTLTLAQPVSQYIKVQWDGTNLELLDWHYEPLNMKVLSNPMIAIEHEGKTVEFRSRTELAAYLKKNMNGQRYFDGQADLQATEYKTRTGSLEKIQGTEAQYRVINGLGQEIVTWKELKTGLFLSTIKDEDGDVLGF